MKFQRGTWQPTTWSGRVLNFCSVQYDVKTMWYQTWSSHIPEDERKCLNNYGVGSLFQSGLFYSRCSYLQHVYHYRDMDVNTVDEFITNMEGRYKIVIQISAFDEFNVKRPNSICFEIIGEYIKYKQ